MIFGHYLDVRQCFGAFWVQWTYCCRVYDNEVLGGVHNILALVSRKVVEALAALVIALAAGVVS